MSTPAEMEQKFKTESSYLTVYKQFKNGELLSEKEQYEEIQVHTFPESVEPAKVSRTLATTINLGNYENVKISVTLTVPCYIEEIDDASKFAESYCSGVIKEKRRSIQKWKEERDCIGKFKAPKDPPA